MQRLKDEGADPSKPAFSRTTSTTKSLVNIKVPHIEESMTKPGINRKISADDLEARGREGYPWFVVNGEVRPTPTYVPYLRVDGLLQVYDGTGFLKDHPGGSHSITLVAGEDATEEFMAIHSSDAKKQLADFHVGTLVGTPIPKTVEEADNPSAPFLSQMKWKKVNLVEVQAVSNDSKVYRFALHHADQELGLPIGQHVYVRLRRKTDPRGHSDDVEGKLVQRAYTPISKQEDRGFIDLLIKCVLVLLSASSTKALYIDIKCLFLIEYIIRTLDILSAAK